MNIMKNEGLVGDNSHVDHLASSHSCINLLTVALLMGKIMLSCQTYNKNLF